MKERDGGLSFRIGGGGFRGFVTVAALTGEGEVFRDGHSARGAWLDVFQRKAFRRKGFGAAAILAQTASPLRDQAAQSFADAFSHADCFLC